MPHRRLCLGFYICDLIGISRRWRRQPGQGLRGYTPEPPAPRAGPGLGLALFSPYGFIVVIGDPGIFSLGDRISFFRDTRLQKQRISVILHT